MTHIIKHHPRTLLAGALSSALMFCAGGAIAQDQDTTAQQGTNQGQAHSQAQDQTHDRTSHDQAQRRDGTIEHQAQDRDLGDTRSQAQDRDRSQVLDRDSDQPINDTWITTKVKSSLLADSDVAGLDVSVETVNGVVRLSGEVDSQRQVDRAIQIARDIEGVTNVESDDLRVAAGSDD